MLASIFIAGGVEELRNPGALVPAAKPVTDTIGPMIAARVPPSVPLPTDTAGWVRVSGGIKVAAGLALATGRFPRLAALVLVGNLAPTTVAGHPFWEETDPATRAQEQTQLFKNLALTGGLLLAAVDVEPSARERVEIAARRMKRRFESD